MSPEQSMKDAIEKAGGAVRVAKSLGITPQAIYQWEIVPAQWVIRLEELCGGAVTRHDLRPDIFGPS